MTKRDRRDIEVVGADASEGSVDQKQMTVAQNDGQRERLRIFRPMH